MRLLSHFVLAMTSEDFKELIEREAKLRGCEPAHLCRIAAKNNKLHSKLVAGGSCTLDTVERFMKWINCNPPNAEGAA